MEKKSKVAIDKRPIYYRTKVYPKHWKSFVISLVLTVVFIVLAVCLMTFAVAAPVGFVFGIIFSLGAAVAGTLLIV